MNLERWDISVGRLISGDICGPSHKIAFVTPDSQRSHILMFSYPRSLDVSSSFGTPDRPVDKGGAGYPQTKGSKTLHRKAKIPPNVSIPRRLRES